MARRADLWDRRSERFFVTEGAAMGGIAAASGVLAIALGSGRSELILAPLFVAAVTLALVPRSPGFRMGGLLLVYLSGALPFLALPRGVFPFLLLSAIVRDLSAVKQAVSGRVALAIAATTAYFALRLSSAEVTAELMAGVALFVYVVALAEHLSTPLVVKAAIAGGVVGAVLSFNSSAAVYLTVLDGQLVQVDRLVVVGQDPNIAASILLLAAGFAAVGARDLATRMLRLVAAASFVLIGVGIVVTGSRTAQFGLAVLVFVVAWSLLRPGTLRSTVARTVAAVSVVAVATSAYLWVLSSSNLAIRWLSVWDAFGFRRSLWQGWLGLWTETPQTFLFGLGEIAVPVGLTQGPHNSVLEVVVLGGVLGFALVASVVWSTWSRQARSVPLRLPLVVAASGVLVQSMTIAMATEYVFWIAVAVMSIAARSLPHRPLTSSTRLPNVRAGRYG